MLARKLFSSLLILISMQNAAFANIPQSTGAGAIVDSPLAFGTALTASLDGGDTRVYEVLAYHLNGSTRVIVVRKDTPFGFAQIDDLIVGEDALTYRRGTQGDIWLVTLDAVLPTFGSISVGYATPLGFTSWRSGGCFYDFVSPTFGASGPWGNISGSIDDREVTGWSCNAWGVGVYGWHAMVPLAEG